MLLMIFLLGMFFNAQAANKKASNAPIKVNQSYMTSTHGAIYILKIEKDIVTFKQQQKASEGCRPPDDVPTQTLPLEKFKSIHHILAVIDCEKDQLERKSWAE